MEDGDLGFMSIFLVLATMLDWEQRLERLRALISAVVVQAQLGVKRGIDTNCRAATRRRLQDKCIKERGKSFLHILSPQRQNALLICLLCWSIFFSCTVTCVM
jgi:hypothetical protein